MVTTSPTASPFSLVTTFKQALLVTQEEKLREGSSCEAGEKGDGTNKDDSKKGVGLCKRILSAF
jgi:hypothetical protein